MISIYWPPKVSQYESLKFMQTATTLKQYVVNIHQTFYIYMGVNGATPRDPTLSEWYFMLYGELGQLLI